MTSAVEYETDLDASPSRLLPGTKHQFRRKLIPPRVDPHDLSLDDHTLGITVAGVLPKSPIDGPGRRPFAFGFGFGSAHRRRNGNFRRRFVAEPDIIP